MDGAVDGRDGVPVSGVVEERVHGVLLGAHRELRDGELAAAAVVLCVWCDD